MSRSEIAVFGAGGHTAAFVVGELARRGWTPILVGRDPARLEAAGAAHPGSHVRIASAGDAGALDRALRGASAVINCAGPFADTAAPLVEAALRARIHYLDVTAEQAVALAGLERHAAAEEAGIAVIPAMAFYGGLGDLLATAAMADWTGADEIRFGIALDGWRPTRGTRMTGQRNMARRLVVADGRLEPLADPPPTSTWTFPAPFGAQAMVAVPLSEIVTTWHHLKAGAITTHMNLAPLQDLRDPDTPGPAAADASGRSSQRFILEVAVRAGDEERRATARGRDIYATSAPLVCEAVERVLDGRARRRGAGAPGEMFDAVDFLESVRSEYLEIGLPGLPAGPRPGLPPGR
ncbi:MAG TPA: saccharopine dehydrogenase NADP-binding domain-containing protein [Kofleriaceae bacterium]|nr:saccharopine dehydrogenase NADP-binding domain-containing protein [Kofleriaceae bacterium]